MNPSTNAPTKPSGHLAPLPVACVPGALTRDERTRSASLRRTIAAGVTETIATRDGYRFRLAGGAEILRDVAAWIPLERRCCPFLAFSLSWDPGSEQPELALSGPDGTKEFLHGEMPELPWHDAPAET